jgi:hypothetical protein
LQQLKESFPEADPYRFVIFDHDWKFNLDMVNLLASTGYRRSARAFRHRGKTNYGAVDRKLPPRDAGPHHPAE